MPKKEPPQQGFACIDRLTVKPQKNPPDAKVTFSLARKEKMLHESRAVDHGTDEIKWDCRDTVVVECTPKSNGTFGVKTVTCRIQIQGGTGMEKPQGLVAGIDVSKVLTKDGPKEIQRADGMISFRIRNVSDLRDRISCYMAVHREHLVMDILNNDEKFPDTVKLFSELLDELEAVIDPLPDAELPLEFYSTVVFEAFPQLLRAVTENSCQPDFGLAARLKDVSMNFYTFTQKYVQLANQGLPPQYVRWQTEFKYWRNEMRVYLAVKEVRAGCHKNIKIIAPKPKQSKKQQRNAPPVVAAPHQQGEEVQQNAATTTEAIAAQEEATPQAPIGKPSKFATAANDTAEEKAEISSHAERSDNGGGEAAVPTNADVEEPTTETSDAPPLQPQEEESRLREQPTEIVAPLQERAATPPPPPPQHHKEDTTVEERQHAIADTLQALQESSTEAETTQPLMEQSIVVESDDDDVPANDDDIYAADPDLPRGNSELQALDVSNCAMITDLQLKEMASCPVLHTLNLAGCITVTDVGLKSLEKCERLYHLNLSMCPEFTPIGLICLGRYSRLQTLTTRHVRAVTDETLLGGMAKAPHLNTLDVSGCENVTDVGLSALKESKRLSHLDVSGCSITDIGVQMLLETNGKRLRELTITWIDALSDRAFEHIDERCRRIESLNVAGLRLSDATLNRLARCDTLQQLVLRWCATLSNDGIAALGQGAKSLRYLDISFCVYVTDSGIERLAAGIHAATIDQRAPAIIIPAPPEDGEDVESLPLHAAIKTALAKKPSLKTFIATGCPHLGDRTLAALARHLSASLESLDMAWCPKVSEDPGLLNIEELPNLTQLNLSGCSKLTNNAVKLLAPLSNLKSLDLSFCPHISDTGLKFLSKNPKMLSADLQNITSDAVTEMRQRAMSLHDGARAEAEKRKDAAEAAAKKQALSAATNLAKAENPKDALAAAKASAASAEAEARGMAQQLQNDARGAAEGYARQGFDAVLAGCVDEHDEMREGLTMCRSVRDAGLRFGRLLR